MHHTGPAAVELQHKTDRLDVQHHQLANLSHAFYVIAKQVRREPGEQKQPQNSDGHEQAMNESNLTATVELDTAVACGQSRYGQCNLPALDEGLTYTQVVARDSHTLLLRSDGTAVTGGDKEGGQCNVHVAIGGVADAKVAAAYEQ